LTGGDSYPVASGFLGRYHHQIIVCIYFNGRFLNRRKVANHDENTEKKPTRRWANTLHLTQERSRLPELDPLSNARRKGSQVGFFLDAALSPPVTALSRLSRLPRQP